MPAHLFQQRSIIANSLLYGAPLESVNTLQCAQNSVACIVTKSSYQVTHTSSSVLQSLHWLLSNNEFATSYPWLHSTSDLLAVHPTPMNNFVQILQPDPSVLLTCLHSSSNVHASLWSCLLSFKSWPKFWTCGKFHIKCSVRTHARMHTLHVCTYVVCNI